MLFTSSYLLFVLNGIVGLAKAASLIDISTYTDNRCNVKSTTAANVSVPLDACVVTVGMQSFQLPTTPCAGGGASSVQNFGFSDSSCSDSWLYYASYGGGCNGADTAGEAFGSIILTCKDTDGLPPDPDGTTTTINVGPAATGSPASASTGASGSDGSSGEDSDSDDKCSGWNCLSHGAKIGIIVGGAVFVILLLGIGGFTRRGRTQEVQPQTYYRPPQEVSVWRKVGSYWE